MRHRVYGKHLGRDKDDRKNLFKGLIHSIFTHGSIETSESKAKAIKGLVDKVINFAKEKNRQHLLQSFLVDKDLRERLIKEIVPKLGNKNSGYTSMVKLGSRAGDQTMVVRMSLIGAEELKPVEKVTSNKRQVTSEKTEETEEKKAAPKKEAVRPARKPVARKTTRKATKE